MSTDAGVGGSSRTTIAGTMRDVDRRPQAAGSAPAEIAAYLADVRGAMTDLDPGVRDGLLDDLPEHLAEVAAADAAPLQSRLGSPAAFAAELRSAAGLAPAATESTADRPNGSDRRRRPSSLASSPYGSIGRLAAWPDTTRCGNSSWRCDRVGGLSAAPVSRRSWRSRSVYASVLHERGRRARDDADRGHRRADFGPRGPGHHPRERRHTHAGGDHQCAVRPHAVLRRNSRSSGTDPARPTAGAEPTRSHRSSAPAPTRRTSDPTRAGGCSGYGWSVKLGLPDTHRRASVRPRWRAHAHGAGPRGRLGGDVRRVPAATLRRRLHAVRSHPRIRRLRRRQAARRRRPLVPGRPPDRPGRGLAGRRSRRAHHQRSRCP